jgi:hypothetical protein
MTLIPIPLSAAAVLTVCVACSSLASVSGAADSPFVGTWVQREAAAGTLFVFKLTVDGTNVTGSGTYSKEGGRSGTLTEMTGDVAAETMNLAFTYDNGEMAQFQGRMAGTTEMSGSLHFGHPLALTPSAIVTFDRKN